MDHLFTIDILYKFALPTRATIVLMIVTLIVLSIGIVWTHVDKRLTPSVTSASIGREVIRRFLGWAIVVPSTINWLIIWGFHIHNYDYTFVYTLQTIVIIFILSNLILSNAESINQVEAYRQRAEQKLRESEQQLQRALRYSPVPLMIHAEDGEVVQINDAWSDITGYKLEDIPTIAKWTERAYGDWNLTKDR